MDHLNNGTSSNGDDAENTLNVMLMVSKDQYSARIFFSKVILLRNSQSHWFFAHDYIQGGW